jgi:hypothetical protein
MFCLEKIRSTALRIFAGGGLAAAGLGMLPLVQADDASQPAPSEPPVCEPWMGSYAGSTGTATGYMGGPVYEPRHETLMERFRSMRRRFSWRKSTDRTCIMYWDYAPQWLPNFGYHETRWRPMEVLCSYNNCPLPSQCGTLEEVILPPSPPPQQDTYSPQPALPANPPAEVIPKLEPEPEAEPAPAAPPASAPETPAPAVVPTPMPAPPREPMPEAPPVPQREPVQEAPPAPPRAVETPPPAASLNRRPRVRSAVHRVTVLPPDQVFAPEPVTPTSFAAAIQY